MKILNFISLKSGRAISNQFIINNGNDYVFQSYLQPGELRLLNLNFL